MEALITIRVAGGGKITPFGRPPGSIPPCSWPMEGKMTVFGFGRKGLKKFMQRLPARFTVGLCDAATHAAAVKQINNAYRELDVTVGRVEKHSSR